MPTRLAADPTMTASFWRTAHVPRSTQFIDIIITQTCLRYFFFPPSLRHHIWTVYFPYLFPVHWLDVRRMTMNSISLERQLALSSLHEIVVIFRTAPNKSILASLPGTHQQPHTYIGSTAHSSMTTNYSSIESCPTCPWTFVTVNVWSCPVLPSPLTMSELYARHRH